MLTVYVSVVSVGVLQSHAKVSFAVLQRMSQLVSRDLSGEKINKNLFSEFTLTKGSLGHRL